jgi:hypothetical protein
MSYDVKLRNNITLGCATVEDALTALKESAGHDDPIKIAFNERSKLHIFEGDLLFLVRLIDIEEPLGDWLCKPDALSYEETYADGTIAHIDQIMS